MDRQGFEPRISDTNVLRPLLCIFLIVNWRENNMTDNSNSISFFLLLQAVFQFDRRKEILIEVYTVSWLGSNYNASNN